MIRELKTEELASVAELGKEFYATGCLPGKLVPEKFIKTWENLYALDMGRIFGLIDGEKVVGALGALMYPDPNDGELVATEMFWFVSSKHRNGLAGIKLFDTYEKWAKSSGAARMMMVHLSGLAPEALERLYLRRGYKRAEIHYTKNLKE